MVARRAPCRQGVWAAARTHGPRAAACSKPAPHLLFNTLPRMLLHISALPQARASGRKSEAPAPPLPEKCFCRQRHVKEANETGRIHGVAGKPAGPGRVQPRAARQGKAGCCGRAQARPRQIAGCARSAPPAPLRLKEKEAQKNCRIRRLINKPGPPAARPAAGQNGPRAAKHPNSGRPTARAALPERAAKEKPRSFSGTSSPIIFSVSAYRAPRGKEAGCAGIASFLAGGIML